jgi:APA family basic amino acid/polyamine antiporter
MTKLVVLACILVFALMFFDIKNYTPFLSTTHPEQGFLGVVLGATLVFYAYLGFDIIPAVAEEA